MPRYFFHVISGEIRQTDAEGKELPGDQSAFDHVISGLQGLRATALQADQRRRLFRRSRDRTWKRPFHGSSGPPHRSSRRGMNQA